MLAGNRLWIANTEGEIYSAGVTDGALAPFTKLGSSISLAPIVANNMLVVLDDSGRINTFR